MYDKSKRAWTVDPITKSIYKRVTRPIILMTSECLYTWAEIGALPKEIV